MSDMKGSTLLLAAAALGFATLAAPHGALAAEDKKTNASADQVPTLDPDLVEAGDIVGEERQTGYDYAGAETQAMQDDDFTNPAFLWVDRGAELWDTKAGAADKSCNDCHSIDKMKGVAARYPVFFEPWGKPMNLEQRINWCRENKQEAKPWKYESDELLSMTAYVANQSKGMPRNVVITDELKPFYEKGKEFYFTRRGQLDLACKHCHLDNNGNMIRAEKLSEGRPNGFPTYRLKWQKLGSTHRRFRGCNNNIRAAKLPYGDDRYVNLELFLAHRDQGLPIEAPSVRK